MHSSQSAGSSSSSVSGRLADVRRGIELWNAGDWGAALEQIDPDVEWRTSEDLPGFDPVYHGHAGVRRFWAAWVETWESMRIDIEQMSARDADIWVLARFQARGRDGLEVDQPVAFQFTADRESGLLRRFTSYWNRDDVPVDIRTSDGGHTSS
jgi:ketosteroid isomerase-like protein